MLDKLRNKLAKWLMPGLREEVYRQAMLHEAMFDIHVLRLPCTPQIYQEAIANCEALQADLNEGKITLQDRAKSLIEVLKRSGIIKVRQKE